MIQKVAFNKDTRIHLNRLTQMLLETQEYNLRPLPGMARSEITQEKSSPTKNG